MKICYGSDLHLEFGPLNFPDQEGDVLVLAGDICVAADVKKYPFYTDRDYSNPNGISRLAAVDAYLELFERAVERFDSVIYVMGNHEHYNGKFNQTYHLLTRELAKISNTKIHLLEDEVFEFDDRVVFIGSTLWTDFKGHDPFLLWSARNMMNDYKTITYNEPRTDYYRKLRPEDVLRAHMKSRGFLQMMLERYHDRECVVVTHHAPSPLSIHPRFQAFQDQNHLYYTDFSELMLERDNLKLWFHGHVHNQFDYTIGGTKVLCNPRGYVGYEVSPEYNYKFGEVEL